MKTREGKNAYIMSREHLMLKCHECMIREGAVEQKLIPTIPEFGIKVLGIERVGAGQTRSGSLRHTAESSWSPDAKTKSSPAFHLPAGVAMVFFVAFTCWFVSNLPCMGQDISGERDFALYDFVGQEKRNRSMMDSDDSEDAMIPGSGRLQKR